MKVYFSQVHWGRILLTDVLLVILVIILNTVLLVLTSSVWGPRTLTVLLVTSWSTSILAILLTVGAAVWVGRKVERAAPLHGFLVGLIAALILLPLGKASIDLVALVIFVLMIAAGWLGGILSSRRMK